MGLLETIIINAIPIGLLAIPLIFLRRRSAAAKFYLRFFIGVIIFFGVYWLLPIIFQIGTTPNELSGPQNLGSGIEFILGRLSSIVGIFWAIPLTQFPFIFLISPIIAFFFIRGRLRGEEGKLAEKLQALTWDYSKSPAQQIKDRLTSGDWTEEKQLLKLLVVLLPISLYLVTTLLDVSGMQSTGLLSSGSSALGWFLEILFVYLATFLMGIHLAYSSKISYKGRFIGEKLREQAFSGLMTVGTPISILSIVLFVAKAVQAGDAGLNSILVTLYFFGYFIMAAVIFVSFLAVFEPVSILLLIKAVDWWKSAKKTLSKIDWNKVFTSLLLGIISAFVGILIFIVFSELYTVAINPTGLNGPDFAASSTPTLQESTNFEMIIFTNSMQFILLIIVMGFILRYAIRYVGKINSAVISFLIGGIFVSILCGTFLIENSYFPFYSQENVTYWATTTPAWTGVFGDPFYTMRILFLVTDFTNPIIQILGTPYTISRWIINTAWIGIFIYYIRHKFVTHSAPDGELIHRTTFLDLPVLPFEGEIKDDPNRYLFSLPVSVSVPETDNEDAKALLKAVEKAGTAQELMMGLKVDLPTLYKRLQFLRERKLVTSWQAEFSYSFKEAKLKSIHVMYTDGRDVFAHEFEESNVDPALVSGMFSAITSFIKETTKSAELLRSIDHGDTSVIIEYGKYIFAAIFADRETSDVRAKLKSFIEEFEDRHGSILVKWNGNVDPFKQDKELVTHYFE